MYETIQDGPCDNILAFSSLNMFVTLLLTSCYNINYCAATTYLRCKGILVGPICLLNRFQVG